MKARLIAVVLGFWAFACLAPAALAETITVSTPLGSVDTSGETVAALVTITTGAGTVTIDLSNTLTASQVRSVGQNLSDLSFALEGVSSAGTVTSSTGTFIDVSSSGAVSSASSSLSAPNSIGWILSNSADDYSLNGLGGNPAATPANTIIGGTAGSLTPYSDATSSIAGSGPHNPFVQGTGVWVLSIAGVTSTTDISDVVFSFGTTPGDNIAAPEPGSLSLLVIGLGALLAVLAFGRKNLLIQQ